MNRAPQLLATRLETWLKGSEDEHLEFKEARTKYDREKLTRYCVALANERGGHIVFGVSDKQPRRVVGTSAFRDLTSLKRDLSQRVRLRIDAATVEHSHGTVVVVSIPSRPIGMPLEYKGSYWMRRGEDLVAMDPETLRQIFAEAQPDYSAEICTSATMADLDEIAIERLRELWLSSSGNAALEGLSVEQLLEDAELTNRGQITYAALILLGSHKGLGQHLAQAETIFEYRSSEASIPYSQRVEFRKGFLLYTDELWDLISLRNEVHFFQDGLFQRKILTFNEAAVREALLNALAHRDYRLGGSIFVRQFPKKLEIVSPGGFPPGITAENVLWQQSPRNRRVAEVMAKCNLVERSGQGMNLIVETCVQESKALPDFANTDDYHVSVVLNGEVRDNRFLSFLEKVGSETQAHFNTEDFLLLDTIHEEKEIPDRLRSRIPILLDQGVIAKKSGGRKPRYILSERFYQFAGKPGTYSRKKGLDTGTKKRLLLEHIERNRQDGSPLRDLQEVLPAEERRHVQYLLRAMRKAGTIHAAGSKRGARWHPGASVEEGAEQP